MMKVFSKKMMFVASFFAACFMDVCVCHHRTPCATLTSQTANQMALELPIKRVEDFFALTGRKYGAHMRIKESDIAALQNDKYNIKDIVVITPRSMITGLFPSCVERDQYLNMLLTQTDGKVKLDDRIVKEFQNAVYLADGVEMPILDSPLGKYIEQIISIASMPKMENIRGALIAYVAMMNYARKNGKISKVYYTNKCEGEFFDKSGNIYIHCGKALNQICHRIALNITFFRTSKDNKRLYQKFGCWEMMSKISKAIFILAYKCLTTPFPMEYFRCMDFEALYDLYGITEYWLLQREHKHLVPNMLSARKIFMPQIEDTLEKFQIFGMCKIGSKIFVNKMSDLVFAVETYSPIQFDCAYKSPPERTDAMKAAEYLFRGATITGTHFNSTIIERFRLLLLLNEIPIEKSGQMEFVVNSEAMD